MQLDQEESLIGQIHGDYEKSSLISVIEKIFVPQKLPTALFCYSDEVAIEVMSWIMKHGYRIPEDVSVVSFDGIPFAERITPSLSTISQPVEYQAKSIINGMLYLQDGVERPCDEKENEYLLQIRDSVGIPGHYEK
jgi:DNA-binding LacI/PurR family transcriptional regulator